MTAKEESEAVLVTTPYRNFADSKFDLKTEFPESNPVLLFFSFFVCISGCKYNRKW